MIEFPRLGSLEKRLTAPDGSIVGIIEEARESAAGLTTSTNVARLGPNDPIPEVAGNYILDHVLSRSDAVTKAQAVAHLFQLRRAGAAIALVSHDEALLESCADEIWWIRNDALIARGDPSEVLSQYRRHVANALRASGENQLPRLSPAMRNGDGRATLEEIELLGGNGGPSTVFHRGETVAIRVTVRFTSPVADPVVGIMIRTRIGLNVYGTNTELEQLKLGPVQTAGRIRVSYRFRCDLCPGEYTVTAASHDPDGIWHDWMEDAVAFSVSDSRYTAGFANLRAHVEAEKL
jgi:lipopolysaccharide transport system ATP-binding protein